MLDDKIHNRDEVFEINSTYQLFLIEVHMKRTTFVLVIV
jgi:hypothetical protein